MGRIGPVLGSSRRVALVVALVVAATLAGAPTPSGAQAAPSLVVTPSTGLVEGQVVQLAGQGFLPNQVVYLVVCPPGVSDGYACDLTDVASTSTVADSVGAFSTSYAIRRFITAPVGGVSTGFDCAVVTCSLAAGDIEQRRVAFTPIDLVDLPPPTPTVTLGPATEGGEVALAVTGFRPGRDLDVWQCPPGVAGPAGCDQLTGGLRTDPTGSASTDLYVRADVATVASGAAVVRDCRVETCTLLVGDGTPEATGAAPLDLSALSDGPTTLLGSPTTGLLDGATISLTAAGFLADSFAHLRQCAVVGDELACPTYNQWSILIDGSEEGSGEAVVRRDAQVTPATGATFVDCAVVPCYLVAEGFLSGSIARRHIVVPLSFTATPRPLIDPEVTVVRTTDDRHTVTGTGFPLGGGFGVSVCGAAAGAPCTSLAGVVPDGTGAFSVDVEIPRFPDGDTGPDCALGCQVRILLLGDVYASSATFTSRAVELSITIMDAGTLDASDGVAVAWAEIRCSAPTDVAVDGAVHQPGVAGSHSFVDRCRPEEPLLAFIPTRTPIMDDVDFVLGPAQVLLWATAVDGSGGGPPVEAFREVVLHDEAAIEASVGAALVDPANVELRALFLRALAARVRQDVVFARELYRALFGGS